MKVNENQDNPLDNVASIERQDPPQEPASIPLRAPYWLQDWEWWQRMESPIANFPDQTAN